MSMTCTEASKFGIDHGYPNYSRTAHSLCNNSAKSGVQRVPELEKLFLEADPKCLTKKYHSPKRKKTCRFSFRVRPEDGEQIENYIKERKFPTTQAFLEYTVKKDMDDRHHLLGEPDKSIFCSCGERKHRWDYCCPSCAEEAFNKVIEATQGLSDAQLQMLDSIVYEAWISELGAEKKRYFDNKEMRNVTDEW